MDIPSCQIGPGTSAKAFVFETSGTVGSGRQGWLFPAAALNAGLFVSGDDVVVSTQRGAFPDAFVQIKDGASFVGKVGIAREDPASCCQGRRASLLSQRHKVAPLISAKLVWNDSGGYSGGGSHFV